MALSPPSRPSRRLGENQKFRTGTGFSQGQRFKVAATGNTLEVDQSFEVVKKLKLVGNAQKIYKNTAYVKGLFNSDLEASKFLGAGEERSDSE